MKRTVVPGPWRLFQRRLRKVVATGRAYFLLSLCSMIMFVLLGLAGMLQQSYTVSPSQSMKGFAASLSGRLFESMLGMELPQMKTDASTSPLQASKLAVFLLRFLTDLNPDDPKSLLAIELPGMSRDQSVLLRSGSGGDSEAPEDHGPSGGTQSDNDPTDPTDPTDPHAALQPSDPPAVQSPAPTSQQTPDRNASPQSNDDDAARKVVFIYHSHNRESWVPELEGGDKDPNDDKINITLVGKRLAKQLEDRGIGAAQSSQDYASTIKSYNWNNSYKYSQQTVKQALAANDDLQFFFDIHRDSQGRSKTTAKINGVDYAQVYFIIGHKNPNWKENEAFASRIQEKLEKKYPGLSRGIWGKSAANGNGEYNQSVSPDSVLIEIGGIENTIRECYRTADALAEVIAEVYWESQDAEKANVSIAQK